MNRRRFGPGGESGQSLVEFALVVPLLLLLLVGMIEFGRAWYIGQALSNAARQGARTAAVMSGQDKSADEIEPAVISAVSASLASNNIACNSCVRLPIPGVGGGANTAVTVTVSAPSQFLILGWVMRMAPGSGQRFKGDSIPTLQSAAVMRNE